MSEALIMSKANKGADVAAAPGRGRGTTRRKGRTLSDAVNAGEFKGDMKLRIPDRVAQFLDWAAVKYPKIYCPYNYVLKAIMGYAKTPMLHTEEVERLRGQLTRVREILLQKYDRELDTQAGVGVRATVDSADTLMVAAPKKAKRFQAARVSLQKTLDIIDVAKLPSTPEVAPWKKWLTTDVRSIMKALETSDFAKRMLPPGRGDEGGGGDGGE